jgi:hypothetical protein
LDQKQPHREITIEVDGPITEYMQQTAAANVRITGEHFELFPGMPSRTYDISALPYAAMFQKFGGGLKSTPANVLFGSKITVTEVDFGADGSKATIMTPYYLYRFIDATDGNPSDQTISFEDTLANADVARTKTIQLDTGDTAQVTVSLANNSDTFSVNQLGDTVNLQFRPVVVGSNSAQLAITGPEGEPITQDVNLLGEGFAPMNLLVRKTDIVTALQQLKYAPAGSATLRAIADQIFSNLSTNLFAEYSDGIIVNGSSTGNTITVDFNTSTTQYTDPTTGKNNLSPVQGSRHEKSVHCTRPGSED